MGLCNQLPQIVITLGILILWDRYDLRLIDDVTSAGSIRVFMWRPWTLRTFVIQFDPSKPNFVDSTHLLFCCRHFNGSTSLIPLH